MSGLRSRGSALLAAAVTAVGVGIPAAAASAAPQAPAGYDYLLLPILGENPYSMASESRSTEPSQPA